MTDAEFLFELDKRFEAIQEADIKGNDLMNKVFDVYMLCKNYLKGRLEAGKKYNNPLNGAD